MMADHLPPQLNSSGIYRRFH